MSGPAVYARPDTPMSLRSAVHVLLRHADYLRERLAELEPGWGSHPHVVDELRAIDTAVALMLHEASVRAEEAPRIRSAYRVDRIPMAAL